MGNFQNAMINEYRRGMIFRDVHGRQWEIVHVLRTGGALCVSSPVSEWFEPRTRPQLVLDLGSVWEGREYTGNSSGRKHAIRFADDGYIVTWSEELGGVLTWPRLFFENDFTPVPLGPAWQPQVGEPAMCGANRVKVLGFDGDYVWIKGRGIGGHITTMTKNLKPVPEDSK